jgi:hypothetical protein
MMLRIDSLTFLQCSDLLTPRLTGMFDFLAHSARPSTEFGRRCPLGPSPVEGWGPGSGLDGGTLYTRLQHLLMQSETLRT